MVHAVIFPMMIVWYFYSSTSQSTCTVPSVAVFCSSLMLCFPGMLLRYFLNDFEMVPVAFIFYLVSLLVIHCTCGMFLLSGICILKSFLASFFITFLSPQIACLLTYMFLFHYFGLCLFYC